MGRTLPTQVQLLHTGEAEWRNFRRALRREDQAAFDMLWTYARRHVTSIAMAERLLPFEAHALSMMLEFEKSLRELKARLDLPFEERTTTKETGTSL